MKNELIYYIDLWLKENKPTLKSIIVYDSFYYHGGDCLVVTSPNRWICTIWENLIRIPLYEKNLPSYLKVSDCRLNTTDPEYFKKLNLLIIYLL